MKYSYSALLLMLICFIHIYSFEVNKDTINFTLSSNCVYLINDSSYAITIDTIRLIPISKIQYYYYQCPWTLILDTSWISIGRNGKYMYTFTYHYNPRDSFYLANEIIKINANDSIKLSGAYLECFYSAALSKSISYQPWIFIDTVNIKFICSNKQVDSVIAIFQFDTATQTINGQKTIQYSRKTINSNYYLLNGKTINSKVKNNKVIKK